MRVLSSLTVCLAFLITSANLPAATILFRQGSQPSSGYLTSITHIRSDTGSSNNVRNFGQSTNLIVGKTTAPGILRGLFSFDISGIPAGATITSVTLSLHQNALGDPVSNPGAVSLNLHTLTSTFVEGNGNASGATNDPGATWGVRSNGNSWTTPGGDFNSTVLSSTSINPAVLSPNAHVFGSTSEFVSAAQAALDGTGSLNMLLKLNSTSEAENIRRASSSTVMNPAPPPCGLR